MGLVDNNSSTGALPEVAKRISSVASEIVTVRLATVYTDSVPPKDTMVVLDNDPAKTPINALGLNFSLPKGTRVVCLAYPPRNMVVLGAIANASGGSTDELIIACDDDTQLELGCDYIQALASGVGSALQINPDGAAAHVELFRDSTGNPDLIIHGDNGGSHTQVRINTNQVRAVASDGVTFANLYLNHGGGTVRIMQGATGGRTYMGTSAHIQGTAGYLHINWDNGLPVAIGNSASSVGRLGGSAGWQCDATLTALGNLRSQNGNSTLGNNLIMDAGMIECVPNVGGTTANANFSTNGSRERLRKNTSSRRYKENIQNLECLSVPQILALQPRQFKRTDELDKFDNPVPVEEAPWRWGFIAEEADELGLRGFVAYENVVDPDNPESCQEKPETWIERIDGFGYGEFAAVAHQIVLRQHNERIAELEAKNAELEERLTRLEALVSGQNQ